MKLHELRKDYLVGDWVIIASGRENRPKHIELEEKPSPKEKCPFCPGREEETPPEILRVPILAKKWRIRVVPNKFGAVDENSPEEKLDIPYRFLKSALGWHEVIIETPLHGLQMCDFSLGRVMEVVNVYIERVKDLEASQCVKEVSVFKNKGAKAGASISHSHSQLIALNKVSPKTVREIKAFKSAWVENQGCPYCEITQIEMDSKRRVYENDSFACFTPFASRAAYQLMVVPKRHAKHFKEMTEKEKRDFAEILKKALTAIKELGAAYNMVIKNAPPQENEFHWHVDIRPRLITRAGFEEATEIIINTHSPENCAEFYREAFSKVNVE